MVKLAFDGLASPVLVLDQNDCTDTGERQDERPIMLKELSRLWAHPQLLSSAGHYGAADTILLDDSPYKTAASPSTRRSIRRWLGPADPGATSTHALAPDGELRSVPRAVAESSDTRDVVRALFDQPLRERFWSDPAKCATSAACVPRGRRRHRRDTPAARRAHLS